MGKTEAQSKAMRITAQIEAMGYRFVGDRVITVRDEAAEKSAGGIIIPDAAKCKPLNATIVALGTGFDLPDERKSDYVLEVEGIGVLTRVLHNKYQPIMIELLDTEGKIMELEVMSPRDIFVIL